MVNSMNLYRPCAFLAALAVTSFGTTALAGYASTTLVGLRVTVSEVAGNQVTVEVSGRGIDSTALDSARLGTQFYFNETSTLCRWKSPVPPAIDWGDDNEVAAAGVPIQGIETTTSGRLVASFSGKFVHTYAAPGHYTVRVFGTNVEAEYLPTTYGITEGNPFRVKHPMYVRSTTDYPTTLFTGSGIIGLTNAVEVAVGNGTGASPGGSGGMAQGGASGSPSHPTDEDIDGALGGQRSPGSFFSCAATSTPSAFAWLGMVLAGAAWRRARRRG